jgi:hypothetical protein
VQHKAAALLAFAGAKVRFSAETAKLFAHFFLSGNEL